MPKRDPKEVKVSNRKIVSQKELNEARKKQHQSTSQVSKPVSSAQPASSGKGKSPLGVMPLIAIGIVIMLLAGGGMSLNSLLPMLTGGSALTGGGNASSTLQTENDGEVNPASLTPATKKPYTVMIYMNGTDLESKYGCATGDLQEIADSGFDPEKINLLILTGGTANWKNNAISSNTSIYHMVGNNLKKLSDLNNASIVDPTVLKNYVDFGITNFPADRYGFVFWNHGGGPIHGYGSDEKNNGAHLSVSDMEIAFSQSEMTRNKFEFIGFDCCLMGTIEIAYLLEPYANYMIASEETEPGYGWDYIWLKTLSDNPGYTGDKIGKVIVDTFVDFYDRRRRGELTTLSVVDLSKMENLTTKFEAFMLPANELVKKGGFDTISKARKGTKSFGYTGQDRSSFDLVDIKHMAQNLSGGSSVDFSRESAELIKAVEESVVYYRNSKNIPNAFGIAAYVPYASKEMAPYSVKKHSEIGIMPNFVNFLSSYTQTLTGKRVERSNITRAKPNIEEASGDITIKLDPKDLEQINQVTFVVWRQLEPGSDYFVKLGLDTDVNIAEDGTIKTGFDGYWATLAGQTACFYEVERTSQFSKYSTPALLNGEDVNLIVIFDSENPDGKLLGAIPPSPLGGEMAAKYLEEIKEGDKITLKYFAQLFLENEADYANYTEAEKWVLGEEFTVNEDLKVEIVPVDDELYLYGFWIEDTQNNSYYTDFIEIRY